MGRLVGWSFSACLSEPAVKISSEALAPLFKPSRRCWAPLPALTQPASQSLFPWSANPSHESKLQQQQQQRAARAAGEEPADAADPEPAGAHLARVPCEQERERRAPLLGPAACQERPERAQLRPHEPAAHAKPERSQRDSLVMAPSKQTSGGGDQPRGAVVLLVMVRLHFQLYTGVQYVRVELCCSAPRESQGFTGARVELWITSHQKCHWTPGRVCRSGRKMHCHFLSFTFQLSAHLLSESWETSGMYWHL